MGQLLFFQDLFVQMARDMPISLETIRALAKYFGNTITSTLWRYVEEVGAQTPVVALVSAHPHFLAKAKDPTQLCRRCIESAAFKERFGGIGEMEILKRTRAYCSFRTRGPLGTGEIILTDVNGEAHCFAFESFSNTHDVHLGVHRRKLASVVGF